jgi:hypothetical protein
MPSRSLKGRTGAGFAFAACLVVPVLLLADAGVPRDLDAAPRGISRQDQEGSRPSISQGQVPSSQGQVPSPSEPPGMNPSPLTPKQQRAVLKANFAKMKEDADQLADLAKSLQEDLNKSNENVLSVGVVEKADKIEKLAKKIKSAAIQ